MSNQLPVFIDPMRFAYRGQTIKGNISLQGMARLSSYLHDAAGVIDVELIFGVDPHQVSYMSVAVKASVNVVCQRCLKPMDLLISHKTKVGMVKSESAVARLGDEYEPFIVGPDPVLLKDLIEDEMILAMPVAPTHVTGECKERAVAMELQVKEDRAGGGRDSPFAVLANLKGSAKDGS